MSVDFNARFASELLSDEISVVAGVNIVVWKWLVHVLIEVQAIEDHRSVLIREHVLRQGLLADLLWKHLIVF